MDEDDTVSCPLSITAVTTQPESSLQEEANIDVVVVTSTTRHLPMATVDAEFDLEEGLSPYATTRTLEGNGDDDNDAETRPRDHQDSCTATGSEVCHEQQLRGNQTTRSSHRTREESVNTVIATLEEGPSAQFWDPEIPSATILGPAPPKHSHSSSCSSVVNPEVITCLPADLSTRALGLVTALAIPVESQHSPWQASADYNAWTKRAEYFSATIVKEKDVPLGVGLSAESNGDIVIAALVPNGKFIHTPFRVGDKLLSIQGKTCYKKDLELLQSHLEHLEGSVTFVGHYEGGNSRLVEAMTEKPTVTAQCGISLRQNSRGSLMISKIDQSGLFANSPLNEKDRVISINGLVCGRLATSVATDMILDSPKYVTILAEKSSATGAVIADSESIRFDGSESGAGDGWKCDDLKAILFCLVLSVFVGFSFYFEGSYF